MSPVGWRGPAALLLLQVLCWWCVGTAMAQQVPSCPINIPATNLTSPAVITIPASGDAVFRLAPGTNYTISDTANTAHAGQTVCIEGLGADNQAVVIQTVSNSSHLILEGGSVLHLAWLTLQGDASVDGGLAAVPSTNLTTITASNLRLTKLGKTAIDIRAPVKFTSHNLELVDNFNLDPTIEVHALYYVPTRSTLPSELTFHGRTLVEGNKAPSTPGAGMFFFNRAIVSSQSTTIEFSGSTSFLDNFSAGGSGLVVYNAGAGVVDVRFKGQLLEFRQNKAVSVNPNTDAATGAGLLLYNMGGKPINVELAADSMIFADNVADSGPNLAAAAQGAAMTVLGTGNCAVTVSVLKPLVFVGNTASPNRDAGNVSPFISGGAVSLLADNGASVTLNVASCVSLLDNSLQPYGAANVSALGAALTVSSDSNVTISVSGPAGQLLFSNNTVSGIGQQDVSIGAQGSSKISCPSVPAKGPGLYRVTNDICAASGASVTSGGEIVGPPASCTSGPCTGLPATVTNSNGWQCPFPDASPEGATCSSTCLAGFFGNPAAICTSGFWRTTGSCAGCTAPPPRGGTTLISGYSSCSTSPISGSYAVGTVCIPVCAAGSSDGLVSCGQVSPAALPGWQVTPCKPDCLGNPPATVPGITSWPCGERTPAGQTCTAACDTGAGWSGGPVAATCTASGWSNATTGSCKRVACIGPPSPQPPNATFTCTSTLIGRACVAKCSPGLTGSPSRVCLATGEFGPLQGTACVDCTGNKPKITLASGTASVLQGSTSVSALLTISGGYAQGTITTQATFDGTIPCTTQPAQLSDAQAATPINVTCQVQGGITAGPHAIYLAAGYSSGSTACGTGSIGQRITIYATPPPPPPPTAKLSAASATRPCKAGPGRLTFFSATFDYEVTPTPVNVFAQATTSATTAYYCQVSRSGPINRGKILVDCAGIFAASVASFDITLTLAAYVNVPGAPLVSASSSQTTSFVCCVASGAFSVAQVVDRVLVSSDPRAYCRTCGSSTIADGVWQLPPPDWMRPSPPPLQWGVLRTGLISASKCTSAGADVGEVTASCDPSNPRLMWVKLVVPSGSSLSLLQFQTRCNAPPANSEASCTEGSYSWRTVSERDNSLQVVEAGGRLTFSFGILISPSAGPGCTCSNFYFALRTIGILALGSAPDSNGNCPAAAAAAAVGAATNLSKLAHSLDSAVEVVAAPADLVAAAKAERRRVRNSWIPVAPLPTAARP